VLVLNYALGLNGIVNSGTHSAHLNEQRPFFLIFLEDNARKMQNYPISIGLFFIENLIFLVKKNFLTKFQKFASERNFDLTQTRQFFPFLV
jgi:hypothetical protein